MEKSMCENCRKTLKEELEKMKTAISHTLASYRHSKFYTSFEKGYKKAVDDIDKFTS